MIIKTVTAHPIGNSMDGIINKTKNHGVNPLSIIKSSYFGPEKNGNPNMLVTGGNFQCYGGKTAWVEFKFVNYLYFPTYYTLRGVSTAWTYSRGWDVYGYNEENKNDESKWDIIGHGTSCANYCGTGFTTTTDMKYATYPIDNEESKEYKYIRWNVTEGSTSSYLTFSASAIELFGKLSISRYDVDCKTFRNYMHVSLSFTIIHAFTICY